MAALMAVLVFLSNLPLVGFLFLIVCSIPITVVTVRQGLLTGALSAVLGAILIGLFLGPLAALSAGLEYGLLGWVIGWMLYRRKSGVKILQAAMLTAGASALVMLFLSLAMIGFTPDAINTYLESYRTEMMEMYESTGMLDAMTQQGMSQGEVTQMLQQAINTVVRVMPAVTVIMRALLAAVTYLLTMQILKRLRIRIPRVHGLSAWRLPFSFVWALIAVWGLWLAGDMFIHAEWLNLLVLNVVIVFVALLFLNGVTLACYWFKPQEMSTGGKVLTVLFVVFFFMGFAMVCVLLGLADLLFDFRKRGSKAKSA